MHRLNLQWLEAESLIDQAQELLRQSRAQYADGGARWSWTKVPMSFGRKLWNVDTTREAHAPP